ncbi:hypothetical protein Tco_0933613 [Tanacetum coccineum]
MKELLLYQGDDVTNDGDDDVDSDDDGDNKASDSERTNFDEDENPNLNQNDDEEEEYEEEYVRTPDNCEFSDDDEEYEELYKDLNVRLKDAEHKEEGKGDVEMTDAGRDIFSQEKSYEQVKDDAHVTLTAAHVTQKTEGPMQSSYVSSDFASQLLNLDNVSPFDNEVVFMMNVKFRHEEPSSQTLSFLTIPVTVIPETSTAAAPTIPPTTPPITPLLKESKPTPTPAPTTETTTTIIPALPDLSSLFRFDQRVSMLNVAQDLKILFRRLFGHTLRNLRRKLKILPKEVSDYATPVIQSTITESLENVILAKSSSQPKSTYEAASSLTEFELKKIILDKMHKSKSYRGAQEYKELYDGLVKSYKLDKDLFESYGKAYSLKRDREDNDKDEDPPAGSDLDQSVSGQIGRTRRFHLWKAPTPNGLSRCSHFIADPSCKRSSKGLKRRKSRKDVEPSKGSKSKESKLSSSKGTKSQPKSSGKSVQAEELVFEVADTEMPQNQGRDLGNTNDQPNVEAASKHDWFKKPERPSTLDSDWNNRKTINFRPPQTWISRIPQAENPPLTFDYRVELEYHFKDYYKGVTDRLDWNNPEGQEYPFDLSKPLPLIEDRGRQVVHVGYFINNDLEYLKGRSSSRKYTTSTTKTKAAKYDDIQGIEDMVPSLWSPVKEIEVRREDQKLYKFNEGDFPRLNLRDIEDMMLLLVQKKIFNLDRDVIFDLNVALRMFDISKRTPYTTYNNPQGIIYIDKYKRNRLMCSDELYKFSDGTLIYVRSVLHDIASNLRMDYLPKRRWSNFDKQRSRIMIKAIDKLQPERSLMRSLEKFVRGREFGEDFRLLEWTI